MRIAIIGATSQIAKDLILSFSNSDTHDLSLFARHPDEVTCWLVHNNFKNRYKSYAYAEFLNLEYDLIINFVGVGDPAKSLTMGSPIFEATLQYDELALSYLKTHSSCRYFFLSSGAAYGSNFSQPTTRETPATFPINNIQPSDWYGMAKLHAEYRHRSYPDLAIVDIRVFNYFSHTQDISSRFLITDIIRSIHDNTILKTSSDYIVRDFMHPSDFFNLINALISAPPVNIAVDCYTLAPIDKPDLLLNMQQNFGLRYEAVESGASLNATGQKAHYYSLNKIAAEFGYTPSLTSLEGILMEAKKALLINK